MMSTNRITARRQACQKIADDIMVDADAAFPNLAADLAEFVAYLKTQGESSEHAPIVTGQLYWRMVERIASILG